LSSEILIAQRRRVRNLVCSSGLEVGLISPEIEIKKIKVQVCKQYMVV